MSAAAPHTVSTVDPHDLALREAAANALARHHAAQSLAAHAPSPAPTPSPSPSTGTVDKQRHHGKTRVVKPSTAAAADDDDYSPAHFTPSSSSGSSCERRRTRSSGTIGDARDDSSEDKVRPSDNEAMKAEESRDEDDDLAPHEQQRGGTRLSSTRMPRDIREVVSQQLARTRLEGVGIMVTEAYIERSECVPSSSPPQLALAEPD